MSINNKLGDPNQNSYVTASQADAYFANRRDAAEWTRLTVTASREAVLIQAANDLETFNYIGEKYYDSQGLQFPRDDHETKTGDCATPFTINSFLNSGLYSTTYGKIPANYWKDGTCHITAGTPLYDIRQIKSSSATNGKITVVEDFTATPNANTDFIIFAPIDKEVRDAQCEQALYILKNANIETLQDYKSMGADNVKIGDTSVSFRKGSSTKTAISPVSRKLLSRFMKRTFTVLRA